MSNIVQLLVLAAIAVFLILRLRSVLGTREGYEKPRVQAPQPDAASRNARHGFEVIEGGPDTDITDHVPEDSPAAQAMTEMKRVEPSFGVGEFIGGARGAYEMILMAYENGEIDDIAAFLSEDVRESFEGGIAARKERGLTIEANFIGVREIAVQDATFDKDTNEAELTVRFVGELTSIVRDAGGDIVEGSESEIKRQRDVWTFARVMGSDNPNWQLVATGQ
ncbi:preprotein translocase subunit Tim44 [Actibacterium mucosum KCTC 23349]|uniref:Preprotein translocase subunit Tim44 n=1 Tax=Actibacterium mucosum KCTC 23349 TaxID=1454373 RepID=A0A037ZNK7_9RHOB|nr:Tim44/TimA family putative adaptor protein [Actibacterium mucosum]KAJ57240.1 preprotein translocase subunit Tim44 [Actibacterium mucosum KCTC 23349]